MNPDRRQHEFKAGRLGTASLRLLAFGLGLLLTGCETAQKYSLTYRLWDNEDLNKFSEPAPNPKLALFETTKPTDVMVEYDALSESHADVKRRSYYLSPNLDRIALGKKPKWAKTPVVDSMKSIPILPPGAAATNPPPEETAYAVTARNERAFILHQPDRFAETFDLPIYPETSGTGLRVALTPFAVAGDTVMVAGVAAVVAFLAWVGSGAPH